MKLLLLEYDFSVCKLSPESRAEVKSEFSFLSRTDEELSLVCRTQDVPGNTIAREDGWKAFRIEGVLDFSLIGILSEISGLLAKNMIGISAVSTYNTDYIFVKKEDVARASDALSNAGYLIKIR